MYAVLAVCLSRYEAFAKDCKVKTTATCDMANIWQHEKTYLLYRILLLFRKGMRLSRSPAQLLGHFEGIEKTRELVENVCALCKYNTHSLSSSSSSPLSLSPPFSLFGE